MQNWNQTVLSQYSNSTRLISLLEMIDEWISPDANFEEFYSLIWNVDSAVGYGLDVWGRIVGVIRVVSLDATDFFGFTGSVTTFTGSVSGSDLTVTGSAGTVTIGQVVTDTTGALVPGTVIMGQVSGPSGGDGGYTISPPQVSVPSEAMVTNISSSGDPFSVSSFYAGQSTTTNFALADDVFRQLILAKAAANLTDGSVPSINAILMNLFPHRGNAFVQDNNNMSMTYVFTFPLSPPEQAIVVSSGVLPRPTGVSVSVSFPG